MDKYRNIPRIPRKKKKELKKKGIYTTKTEYLENIEEYIEMSRPPVAY
tara:strand:- start:977 stop:1120 length:144 start_codon:yes stop_codon:yes gene_type:complete